MYFSTYFEDLLCGSSSGGRLLHVFFSFFVYRTVASSSQYLRPEAMADDTVAVFVYTGAGAVVLEDVVHVRIIHQLWLYRSKHSTFDLN